MNEDHKFTIRQHLKQADKLHQVAAWHFDEAATLALDAGMSLDDVISIAVDDLRCRCFSTIELGLKEAFEATTEAAQRKT